MKPGVWYYGTYLGREFYVVVNYKKNVFALLKDWQQLEGYISPGRGVFKLGSKLQYVYMRVHYALAFVIQEFGFYVSRVQNSVEDAAGNFL